MSSKNGHPPLPALSTLIVFLPKSPILATHLQSPQLYVLGWSQVRASHLLLSPPASTATIEPGHAWSKRTGRWPCSLLLRALHLDPSW